MGPPALPDSDSNPPQTTRNSLGQTIGFPLPAWTPPPFPVREPLVGRYCRLEPLDPDRHAEPLYAANCLDTTQGMWTYLAYGPFESLNQYREWMQTVWKSSDPLFFAVVDSKSNQPVGVASYLRIEPVVGTIEVGHLAFSPLLQRTAAATESMFLMMRRAFELGYRRYEWKCDALNAPSRTAAERLGFRFEGIFRQATIYKQRNRDTAWYSILDREWPSLETAFLRWLDPANFDEDGKQITRLFDLTATLHKP
ncbi:MAG: N-acetyltransferase [Planctomycetaceae bacterium]|nr:N-acetyltransferase [Planctomycetaceae bacterium]